MFKLNETFESDRRILRSDYIRYSSAETSTISTPYSHLCINIPRKISFFSLLYRYIDLNFEDIKKADNSRYTNGNDVRLVILGPIALFSNFKMTSSSGKHLGDISHAYIVSFLYKLSTSSRSVDDLSFGFDRDRNRTRDELAKNKNIKSKYRLRIMLKNVFSFVEHQEKATYGIGYKLTLTRNKDGAVLDKAAGFAVDRNKNDHIHWYIPITCFPFLNKLYYLNKF